MLNELTRLIDDSARVLSSWLPEGLRTLLDDGAHLMTSWMDKNQVTELTGAIVLTGLFITGLSMIGIMLGSPASSHQK